MTRFITFFSALLLLCLLSTASYCQDSSPNKFWLSGGLGKSELPSGMFAFGYELGNKPTILISRYTLNTEIFPDIRPAIEVSEFALLYGYKMGKFSFAAGLSSVWGQNRGKFLWSDPDPLIYGSAQHETIKYTTIGIPAEIRFIIPSKYVGIGLTGFGNWNAKRSFAGLNISVYAGRMK
ncbi:hypothetical protein ACFSUS_00985 [Spirosoma soli]|uniref:Outer membrane beta-barrel protein n=1 Tax=Spirosoma soli TaxID=1770529 RepID=A0ABW5LX06_9BACT